MKITLKAARVNAGLTQKKVAKKLNVSARTIAYWESGTVEPSVSKFFELCQIYDVKADAIFLPSSSQNANTD